MTALVSQPTCAFQYRALAIFQSRTVPLIPFRPHYLLVGGVEACAFEPDGWCFDCAPHGAEAHLAVLLLCEHGVR